MSGYLVTAGGQILFLLIVAPLINGIIKKAKALTQCRRGPGIFQPYFDLFKFLQREAVVSHNTSWITRAAPYICLGAYLAAGSLIPVWQPQGMVFGDIIALTYLFALSRFFLALAGLEPASAFGGMGSSREMMISTLVETVLVLGLFGLVLAAGTTDLGGLAGAGQNPAGVFAFIGLMIATVAETGRIPVDNPDTHLELTMVHEAMLLEYSGRQLGFLHWAAMVKQAVLLLLLAHLFWPQQPGVHPVPAVVIVAGKVALLGLVLAAIESIMAKMRLFKIPELMVGGAAFCLLAVLTNSFV
ncbi:MAG: respiratory chain complex I subunit 1 family protein [Bacillota bacterium]